jgi:hypothetical protein
MDHGIPDGIQQQVEFGFAHHTLRNADGAMSQSRFVSRLTRSFAF